MGPFDLLPSHIELPDQMQEIVPLRGRHGGDLLLNETAGCEWQTQSRSSLPRGRLVE